MPAGGFVIVVVKKTSTEFLKNKRKIPYLNN